MTLRSLARRVANSMLSRYGLEIVRKSEQVPNPFTMEMGLRRARALQLGIRSIIDIGASDGKWSREAMQFFTDCRFLLLEPLEERRRSLDLLKQRCSGLDYELAAAGDLPGEAILSVAPDLDGSGISDTPNPAARTVPVTTIDREVQRTGLPPPYALKFDTHGYEVQILEGSRETLRETRLIIMEVYSFQLERRSLRFHEMCAHLESLGFRCYDLVDPMLRPADDALWQMDLFFLPSTTALFTHPAYGVRA